ARIAFLRLWPIGAFAIVIGALAWIWPQVAAVGAGYAIWNALAWRNRERAVAGVEERDGVRFYVEPGSALQPVKLVRTPGLHRGAKTVGHPPPPPPSTSEPGAARRRDAVADVVERRHEVGVAGDDDPHAGLGRHASVALAEVAAVGVA